MVLYNFHKHDRSPLHPSPPSTLLTPSETLTHLVPFKKRSESLRIDSLRVSIHKMADHSSRKKARNVMEKNENQSKKHVPGSNCCLCANVRDIHVKSKQ